MRIDFTTVDKPTAYHVMSHSVLPRPVAWVLSENENGSLNLAPFSYFQAIGSQPPTLMISVGNNRDGSHKDTRRNIEARSHFVIHVANTEQAEAVNETSRALPPEASEVEAANLPVVTESGWPLPRLKDAPIAFLCSRSEVVDIAGMGVIFGTITSAHLNDDVLGEPIGGKPTVDPLKLDPLARLGFSSYGSLGRVFDLPRPQ